MTSPSHSDIVRWLLEVTAAAAPADPAAFEAQRQLLLFVAQFDQPSRTWWTRIGALDIRALTILQRLYEAARQFGTEVHQPVAAPGAWQGPCFYAGELASLGAAEADRGRMLGQLHVS